MPGESELPVLRWLMIEFPIQRPAVAHALPPDARIEIAQPHHGDVITFHQQRGVGVEIERRS
jgi:hypothetical protein